MLAATVVLWIIATVLLQGLHGTAASARDRSAPAFLDAIAARAALSDADRAAWQSFRSGEAQLTGPGQQYQDDITAAGQDLEGLAALEPAAGPAGQQLQTASGQLVNYQALVEQADAANRTDIAMGTASGHDLGYAYLTYASSAMRNPQGGLLASINELARTDQRAVDGQLASPWTSPALFGVFAAADVLVLCSIVVAGRFLLSRFRRLVSPALLVAALLTSGLLVWVALVTFPADSAFAAARGTALPQLEATWQDQTRAVDLSASQLRNSAAVSGPAAPASGLNVLATQRASTVLDADLASAEDTGGLPVGIPVAAIAIAGLAYLGIKVRLDEYRR